MPTLADIIELLDAEESKKALKEALRLVNSDSDNAELLADLSAAFMDHDDSAGACAVLAAGIERHPTDPRLLQHYGEALLANADLDEAREWLEKAMEAYPATDAKGRAHCMAVIGQVLACDDDFDGAEAMWKNAIALDPKCAEAASALDLTGDAAQDQAEQRNTFPEYQEYLTRVLAQGREEGAIDDKTPEDEMQEIRRLLGAIFDNETEGRQRSIRHVFETAQLPYEELSSEDRFAIARDIDVDWNDLVTVLERYREARDRHEAVHADDKATATGADVASMIASFDYGFLAPGDMRFALLAHAALETTGLTADRIDRIVRMGDATREEAAIFQWAAGIGAALQEFVRSGQARDGSVDYGRAEALVRKRVEIDYVVTQIMDAVLAAISTPDSTPRGISPSTRNA